MVVRLNKLVKLSVLILKIFRSVQVLPRWLVVNLQALVDAIAKPTVELIANLTRNNVAVFLAERAVAGQFKLNMIQ